MVKYPSLRKLLLSLEAEDQKELRSYYKKYVRAKSDQQRAALKSEAIKHKKIRSEKLEKILGKIRTPTVENIGLSGSKAVSTLTLHSNPKIIKKILTLYESEFSINPKNIYFQAIPPLKDRLSILSERKQIFGTNWYPDSDGNFHLIPLYDFKKAFEKRKQYGLDPIKRPKILSYGAKKYPLGRGYAKPSDQKIMTDDEFNDYAGWF